MKINISRSFFRDKACQFGKQDAAIDEMVDAGLVCLYNGKDGDKLDALKYSTFCSKVQPTRHESGPRHCPLLLRRRDVGILAGTTMDDHLLSERETEWGGWRMMEI